MTLTTVGDPATWCHVEFDEHDLVEEARLSGAEQWDGVARRLDQAGKEPAGDRNRLLQAVEVLEADLPGTRRRVRAHHLVEPVLDLWEMAGDVDAEATGRLEMLLGRLTGVSRVSPGVVRAILEEVRRQLNQDRGPS